MWRTSSFLNSFRSRMGIRASAVAAATAASVIGGATFNTFITQDHNTSSPSAASSSTFLRSLLPVAYAADASSQSGSSASVKTLRTNGESQPSTPTPAQQLDHDSSKHSRACKTCPSDALTHALTLMSQDHPSSSRIAFSSNSSSSSSSSSDSSASPPAPSSPEAAAAIEAQQRKLDEMMQGLTPEQKEELEHMSKTFNEHELKQCMRWKEIALKNSRKVNYMLRAMKRLGCHVDPWSLIVCAPCGRFASGGAAVTEESAYVLMCANGIKSYDQFETVLTHELIHCFDHCRAEVDLDNIQHHACMEVRASNLSGDCTFMREARIGNIFPANHHPKCVRRRAMQSMLANPNIHSVAEARAVVEAVYDRCSKDTEPFGSVPW